MWSPEEYLDTLWLRTRHGKLGTGSGLRPPTSAVPSLAPRKQSAVLEIMIVMNPFFTRAIPRAVRLLPHFPTQALLTILFPPHGIDTRPSNSKINSVRHDVDGRSSTYRSTWCPVGVEHVRHTLPLASCLIDLTPAGLFIIITFISTYYWLLVQQTQPTMLGSK